MGYNSWASMAKITTGATGGLAAHVGKWVLLKNSQTPPDSNNSSPPSYTIVVDPGIPDWDPLSGTWPNGWAAPVELDCSATPTPTP